VRTCSVCGREYRPVMPHQRLCSRACRGRRPRTRGTWEEFIQRSPQSERRRCLVCGRAFIAHPKQRTTFCSKSCGNKARLGWRMEIACPVPWRTCRRCGLTRYGRPSCCRAAYVPRPEHRKACLGCDAEVVSRGGRPRVWCLACLRLQKQEDHRKRRGREVTAFRTQVVRRRIYERDGWNCQLCRKPVRRDAVVPHPLAPTLDHIVPLARGGTHEPRNVQLAHFRCNTAKGARGDSWQLRLIA
jgi:5-methylcytosine-specific restriction endonuclease McrA